MRTRSEHRDLATHMPIAAETLVVDLQQRFSRDIYERCNRLAFVLAQDIKRAYAEKLHSSDGESGSLGGILAEVRRSQSLLEINFGFSKAAHYLANIELGEHGTISSPRGGAAFTRRRMPPVEAYVRWIERTGIQPKAKEKDKRSRSEKVRSMAFAMARSRQQHGIPAMRVMEKTLAARSEKIRQYLQTPV
jgi:hypothetical protein